MLLDSPEVKQQYDVALTYGRSYGPSVADMVIDLFWLTVTKGLKWSMANQPILKVLRVQEWASLLDLTVTSGAPIDQQDGFIHFSSETQVTETVARHFKGETGLILLTFDASTLGDGLRFEPSRGGQLFPHLYGPLRLQDACLVRPWTA
ncbi:MAG: DUF952 domain-containing protein [Myxococcota bacterium]